MPFHPGSPLRRDERVSLFDTAATPHPTGGWIVPVHAWVREQDSELGRGAVVGTLAKILELTPTPDDEALLVKRGLPFLSDDESWKAVVVEVDGRPHAMPLTDFEGHARDTMLMPAGRASESSAAARVVFPEGLSGEATARIHLVPAEGTTVISDIDDTVKISGVADRTELLANTFLRPFRPVPGMPELYRRWEAEGARFHYLTSSPWQLHDALQGFLRDAGLPAGPMEMKTFSASLGRFAALFADPLRTKLPPLIALLRAWPRRRFVLVGDSTERDAEVYAEAARRFPTQVARIYIRRGPGGDASDARFEAAFAGLPRTLWSVFERPEGLTLL